MSTVSARDDVTRVVSNAAVVEVVSEGRDVKVLTTERCVQWLFNVGG